MTKLVAGTVGAVPAQGNEVPFYDDYLNPLGSPGLTVKRRTWLNTGDGPIKVSPIQQDKTYLIARKAHVIGDVWEYTTLYPILGSKLVSPAQDADHSPPEMQEVVPIADGEKMLMIWETL